MNFLQYSINIDLNQYQIKGYTFFYQLKKNCFDHFSLTMNGLHKKIIEKYWYFTSVDNFTTSLVIKANQIEEQSFRFTVGHTRWLNVCLLHSLSKSVSNFLFIINHFLNQLIPFNIWILLLLYYNFNYISFSINLSKINWEWPKYEISQFGDINKR